MLRIQDLNFGFNDAENYKRSENKNLLNKVFLEQRSLKGSAREIPFFLSGKKELAKLHMQFIYQTMITGILYPHLITLEKQNIKNLFK